ncbi:hypothetical protein PFISCL1PPCAC_14345, partial [Pristionchus fissidentatus]
MSVNRPVPDNTIVAISSTIGLISMALNLFCFFLLVKMRRIYALRIFTVLISLQVLLTVQNFHFTVLHVPFMYVALGGGYCIGLLCEPHRLPFSLQQGTTVFLMVNISGLFMVLLFYRHQSVLSPVSILKLGKRASNATVSLLILGINILPLVIVRNILLADPEQKEILLREQCPKCDWIEKHRNYAVTSAED